MSKIASNRIFAIILTLIMTLSMSGFAVENVFAETEVEADDALQTASDEAVLADNAEEVEEEVTPETPPAFVPTIPIVRRTATTGWVQNPGTLLRGSDALNLRTLIGASNGGYSVVQGSCTDGTYAYYLMIDSSNNKGKVAKVNMGDNSLVQVTGVLDIVHGNGMTYDSKRGLLVISQKEGAKQDLFILRAGDLSVIGNVRVRYTYYNEQENAGMSLSQQEKGIAAIAYCAEYDCYVALQRENRNLILYSPYNVDDPGNKNSLQAIGLIKTKIKNAYPNLHQGMDADGQFAYLLLSPADGQPYNIILAMEWNAEENQQVLEETIGRPEKDKCLSKSLKCGGSAKNGEPTATIAMNLPYETESIYHTTDSTTQEEHFYVAAYYSHNVYKWGKVKQAYQVKWKKVWKKVKWKKVKKKYKKNGKKYYKYVWKYKKKKVWAYKTKYRYVDGWVYDYFGRDDYVFDLGILMKKVDPPKEEEKQEEINTEQQTQPETTEQVAQPSASEEGTSLDVTE